MKGMALAFVGALGATILIMVFVYFIDIIIGLALFIGLGIIIGVIIIGIVVFVVMFLALFYYLAVKKPKVESGEYKLEEVKDEEH